MNITDAVRRPVVTIEADRSVRDAAVLMESSGVGALVVCDEGRPVGMVTDRDLVRRALAPALDPAARVDGVMTMPLESIDADADLHDAARAFHDKAVRRLAVTDGDRLVGVIAVDDLLIDMAGDLAELVRPLTAEAIFAQHDAPGPEPVDAHLTPPFGGTFGPAVPAPTARRWPGGRAVVSKEDTMLVITMRCDRPGCGGTVEFAHAQPGGSRHNLGRCDSCGERFRLHGGQVDPVAQRGATTGTRGHVSAP